MRNSMKPLLFLIPFFLFFPSFLLLFCCCCCWRFYLLLLLNGSISLFKVVICPFEEVRKDAEERHYNYNLEHFGTVEFLDLFTAFVWMGWIGKELSFPTSGVKPSTYLYLCHNEILYCTMVFFPHYQVRRGKFKTKQNMEKTLQIMLLFSKSRQSQK